MSLYTEKSSRIRLTNRIKNIKGRSTSSEVDPSILAPKGAVHFKNENIRYEIHFKYQKRQITHLK